MPIIRLITPWLTGLLFTFLTVIAPATAKNDGNSPPDGDWLGVLSTPGGELRLLVTAIEQADGPGPRSENPDERICHRPQQNGFHHRRHGRVLQRNLE